MTSRPPLRFGVLGCADIARRRVLPAMSAAPDIEVVAVASRSAARARALAEPHGARPVTGYAALLADDTVEAVYVPLPAALHAEWAEAALRAGKHVLVEKPVADTAARARELVGLAKSRGLALSENVMFVHHRQHAVVRDLLAQGAIGELRSLHASFAIPGPANGDIRYAPELGGGALADVGIYPLRACLYFLGRDLAVLGAAVDALPGQRVDTSGAVLLRRGDGVVAHVSYGFRHTYRSSYELCGSAGRITVDRAFTPPADHHPLISVEGPQGTRTVRLEPDDQVANSLAAFVAGVRGVQDGGAAKSSGDILAQADLLEAVRRSARRLPSTSSRSSQRVEDHAP